MRNHPDPKIRFEEAYETVPWSGCWIWMRSGLKEGYGRIKINRKNILAHRYSYERFIGLIPNGMLVCHSCDEPACVNPNHLFLGTDMTNTIDKVKKGRQSKGERHGMKFRGSKHYMSHLTEEAVIAIRSDTRNQRDIASDYGVRQSTISFIKLRKTWKHI